MKKQVEITIDAFNNVNAVAQGFNGVGCAEATKFIEELGGKVDQTLTSDYYASNANQVQECVRL